jgi:dephospho-CoA kinase
MSASPVSAGVPRRTVKPVVGLVGGIGSGKSLVAQLLAEQGGAVIDADHLGHEALRQPEVREQIVARWGTGVLREDGSVNRRAVAAIVFADPAERRALEALVFPWIERGIRAALAEADRDPRVRFVVLDAAILLETGWREVCDLVVFVDAPRAVRLGRLAAQRGWTEADVAARERAQFPLEEKKARADVVIDNSGDPAQTRRQVEQLVARLRPPLPHGA